MAKIILAHGILGFGGIFPKQPINYFNGIKELFEASKHEVLCPTVAPLGSLQQRAEELEDQILKRWPDGGEPLFMLAHSMGGLDCRRVLANNAALAKRTRRLVTVATPHFGSPVADVATNLPGSIFAPLSPVKWISDLFGAIGGAVGDLVTRGNLQDQDVPSIEYVCIGCDAQSGQSHSLLFASTAAVGGFGHARNDGVVSLGSASNKNDPGALAYIWPVDHGGAIGWPSGGIGAELAQAAKEPPQAHLDRYSRLLPHLIA